MCCDSKTGINFLKEQIDDIYQTKSLVYHEMGGKTVRIEFDGYSIAFMSYMSVYEVLEGLKVIIDEWEWERRQQQCD